MNTAKMSAKAYTVTEYPCPRDGSTMVLMEDVGYGTYYSATCRCGAFVTNRLTEPDARRNLRLQCQLMMAIPVGDNDVP